MIGAGDALVDAARAGDEAALVRLLAICRPDLARYARRACESDDVEEAVQDALWLMYRRIGGLRTGAALSSWMFQVVRRLCLKFTRRRSAREWFSGAALSDQTPDRSADECMCLDLARALGQLPASYRDVLVLRDMSGFAADEVAAELGLSVDAVKSRLHRARALMREQLRPEPGAVSLAPRAAGLIGGIL